MNGDEYVAALKVLSTEHEVSIRVLEQRLAGTERALELQAKEYERRLTDLNHAHDKQVQDQRTYVSMDKFDGAIKDLAQWRAQVDRTLTTLDGRSSGIGAARAVFFQVIPLLFSAAALLAMLWGKS